MTRKIVQIATPFCGEGAIPVTLALADDGTLWQGHWEAQGGYGGNPLTYTYKWEEIPNIPQWNANMTKVK